MPRISDQNLKDAVAEMAEDTGLPLEPYWAYGRVRLLIVGQETRHGRGRSPFTPDFDSNGELMTWMDAFMQGWKMRGSVGAK